MQNRETLDLITPIGSSSTWYNHFRHSYEFVQALYDSLDTNHVDYDSRKRDSITEENFWEKLKEYKKMIIVLSTTQKDISITLTAQKTYSNLEAITSIGREVLELKKHEEDHHNYVSTEERETEWETDETYTITNERIVGLEETSKIKKDIEQDRARYWSVPSEYISNHAKIEYEKIINKLTQLDQHRTDNILLFKNTITSVKNEYYKIEEELVHLLYDILLFIENNQKEFFTHIKNQDPNFWMARSTLIHIDS